MTTQERNEALIAKLKKRVAYLKENFDDPNETCWDYQQGVLISAEEAEMFVKLLTVDRETLNTNK